MKTVLLVLVLLVSATTAQAAPRNESLLQCGLTFGGATVVSSAKEDSRKQKTRKQPDAMGMIGSDVSGIATSMLAKSKSSESRLPRIVTVAQLGCSW